MQKGKLFFLTILLCTGHALLAQQPILGLRSYFEEAYWRYPNIPKGLLEAAAYSASRFTNLQPASSETYNCTGMPERYGVFGLIENGRGYFKNNMALVCHVSNITPAQFKEDVRLQILSVAKLLSREATVRGMKVNTSAEDFADVFDRLSELPDDSSTVNLYAHALYKFEIYDQLQKGFNTPMLKRAPARINMEKIFPAPLLRILKAKRVTIDYNKDSIRTHNGGAASVAGGNFVRVASVTETDDLGDGDYPYAVYVQASARNYQSGRNGAAITNITIHTTEGSYAGTISWFKNPGAVVSAHYVIRSGDGQITQMVREADMAYHVISANSYTIGIEHEGYVDAGDKWYTEAMYTSSAALVRNICGRHDIDVSACFRGPATATTDFQPLTVRIKGHQHYSGNTHTDPGKYWNWSLYGDLLLNVTRPKPTEDTLQVAPNPVTSNTIRISYRVTAAQSATLIISDTNGRAMLRHRIALQTGNNKIPVNISMLKPGVYLATLYRDGKGAKISRKFIKQ